MNSRIWVAAALVLSLAACAKQHPTAPPLATPAVRTPEAAVAMVPWSWEHRDLDRYSDVLTEDFVFVGPVIDSTGVVPPDSQWVRAEEIVSVNHIFQGGAGHLRADAIQVTFGAPLVSQPDPRPGRDPKWHRVVRTVADAVVTVSSGGVPTVLRVHGYALFSLVRGDSAAVPAGSAFGRDSTTWWIERWDDETATAGLDHSWMWLRRAFF